MHSKTCDKICVKRTFLICIKHEGGGGGFNWVLRFTSSKVLCILHHLKKKKKSVSTKRPGSVFFVRCECVTRTQKLLFVLKWL